MRGGHVIFGVLVGGMTFAIGMTLAIGGWEAPLFCSLAAPLAYGALAVRMASDDPELAAIDYILVGSGLILDGYLIYDARFIDYSHARIIMTSGVITPYAWLALWALWQVIPAVLILRSALQRRTSRKAGED